VAGLKQWIADDMGTLEPQATWGRVLREEMPDETIFVTESTQVGYWLSFGGLAVEQPRTFIGSGYQGTLGNGFPTALGAQVGNPDRRVVSINGDGGFMFNVQELATAVQHEIPLITIVFDDSPMERAADAGAAVRQDDRLGAEESVVRGAGRVSGSGAGRSARDELRRGAASGAAHRGRR
jgi:thiamine pyrophosphate-dependent acetolactate synthase large subunit-like protein